MTKPEALDKLIKSGYCASLESNVIMADLPDSKALDGFRNKLQEIGYNASFGFRIRTSSGLQDALEGNLEEEPLKFEVLAENVAASDMPELYHIGDDGQMQFF